MDIANDITELAGKTPLVRLRHGVGTANVLVKLEAFNPTGSVKYRVATAALDAAESSGAASSGVTTIVEATLGDTGEALASVCAARDFRLILCVPDNVSERCLAILKEYGAEVVLTPGEEGLAGAVKKALEIAGGTGEYFYVDQFNNPVNATIHYLTTGEEIWHDSEGSVDILVAGVGTGGTISGASRRLKEHRVDIEVVAVEPAECATISNHSSEAHDLSGIGAGIVGDNYDALMVDKVMTVDCATALETKAKLALYEGIRVGASSGAAIAAALEMSHREENAGKTIVVIAASGE